MTAYQDDIEAIRALKERNGSGWDAIDPESAARMRAQNRFRTGLEIAQYTAERTSRAEQVNVQDAQINEILGKIPGVGRLKRRVEEEDEAR